MAPPEPDVIATLGRDLTNRPPTPCAPSCHDPHFAQRLHQALVVLQDDTERRQNRRLERYGQTAEQSLPGRTPLSVRFQYDREQEIRWRALEEGSTPEPQDHGGSTAEVRVNSYMTSSTPPSSHAEGNSRDFSSPSSAHSNIRHMSNGTKAELKSGQDGQLDLQPPGGNDAEALVAGNAARCAEYTRAVAPAEARTRGVKRRLKQLEQDSVAQKEDEEKFYYKADIMFSWRCPCVLISRGQEQSVWEL
ncbi:hypothetical protein LTR66_000848 [Elasticomyces elasticus]|nr:hypothetical protein LTR66_000848 [Elasticomyces elasticus]